MSTFRVIPTDCRTGYMVVNYAGRRVETEPIYRRRETADARCVELNNPRPMCVECGQTSADAHDGDGFGRCPRCVALERAPQGDAVRLFEPAPVQIPGQLGFGECR